MLASACDGGGLPEVLAEAPEGRGPKVVWDLAGDPLPEIPLPNDVATWPDSTSPTGLRINASMIAPTILESTARAHFAQLDGWGTYAPITVPFDAMIDLAELQRRQGAESFAADAWPDHAIYVVDLETGIPAPVDFGGGSFQYALADTDNYYEADPRRDGGNLIFESFAEDVDGDGVLDPGEDTDFDGVLDVPNTIDGTASSQRDALDRLVTFYERETNTLLIRPIVPLRSRTRYAVVLTDRLRGNNGDPVRSPFDSVHPLSQTDRLRSLPEIFASRPDFYGDLAERGLGGVAFAFSFTTQSVHDDMDTLRAGLYGEGPLAPLAERFPPHLTLAPLQGQPSGVSCDPDRRTYIAPAAQVVEALRVVGTEAFGLSQASLNELLSQFDSISHLVLAFFETPYLLGDPDNLDTGEVWELDAPRGRMRVGTDLVPMLIAVPKETEAHQQPFPVTLYSHGYTLNHLESLGFAPALARQGIATAAIAAQGHGLGLEPLIELALGAIFGTSCLSGLGKAISIDRARDLDGDNVKDVGDQYWTAYVFHTRDVVRQSVLDHMQAIRILRSFEGDPSRPNAMFQPGLIRGDEALEFTGDTSGDGAINRAGDFDGDGRPDVGGFDQRYTAFGQSLGGIHVGILAGLEPAIEAAVPVSLAGGMSDVSVRSTQPGVKEAVTLRTLGPFVVGRPYEGPAPETACVGRQLSLRFLVPSGNDLADIEFGCVNRFGAGDVVVVRNLSNRERRCAAVSSEGSFRVGVPSDAGDLLQLEVYAGARAMFDYDTCESTPRTLAATQVISSFLSGASMCSGCAEYEGRQWEVGDTLVAPAAGYGLRRQSPELRRLLSLAQVALEPADPINYARRVVISPVGRTEPRSLLNINVIGDMVVPISAGNAYARAAGLLPFMPASAPDEFRDYRAPLDFQETYGSASPSQLMVDTHVLEGVPRLERHPVAGASHFLYDIENLSEGQQAFNAAGDSQVPLESEEPSFEPERAVTPLRWVRRSRSAQDDSAWSPEVGAPISGILNPMLLPIGNHSFGPPNPEKRWDESQYLANLVAVYLASGGRDLRYHSDPDNHTCLESNDCSE